MPKQMTIEEKLKLITRNLEEVLTEGELKELIESDTPLKHYIGFEISGKVHLGTGFATMLKIELVLGSELYERQGNEYGATVVKVSKATTIARMLRSTTIMGRKESDIS